jgi:hypothetical protein
VFSLNVPQTTTFKRQRQNVCVSWIHALNRLPSLQCNSNTQYVVRLRDLVGFVSETRPDGDANFVCYQRTTTADDTLFDNLFEPLPRRGILDFSRLAEFVNERHFLRQTPRRDCSPREEQAKTNTMIVDKFLGIGRQVRRQPSALKRETREAQPTQCRRTCGAQARAVTRDSTGSKGSKGSSNRGVTVRAFDSSALQDSHGLVAEALGATRGLERQPVAIDSPRRFFRLAFCTDANVVSFKTPAAESSPHGQSK